MLQVVDEVATACEKCGFFMIRDHGADEAVIDEAWKVSAPARHAPRGRRSGPPTARRGAPHPIGAPAGARLPRLPRVLPGAHPCISHLWLRCLWMQRVKDFFDSPLDNKMAVTQENDYPYGEERARGGCPMPL